MFRFLLGVVLGASVMYWYETGDLPYRNQLDGWFSGTAASYKGDGRRSEADRLIEENGAARKR